MAHVIELVQNDTLPAICLQLFDSDCLPLGLNAPGTVVDFLFRKRDGDKSVINTGHTLMTIVDAIRGTVRYDWVAGDLAGVGFHEATIRVTFPTGVQTAKNKVIIFVVKS